MCPVTAAVKTGEVSLRYRRNVTPIEDEQPLYMRIADGLRQQIADGDLAEGARLPSETNLATTWAAGRPTVRQALDELRRQGLVSTSPSRGTFVSRKPTLRVRSSDRYRRSPAGPTSPFARDAQREGKTPGWTWSTARVHLPTEVAEQLRLAPGVEAVQTTYLYTAEGSPIQTSVSWEPWDLIGGTAIEEPEGEGRITGVVARMDAIGIRVTNVVEKIRTRPATPDERHTLQIPGDTWVQQIWRTHWAGDRAVEAARIIVPGDRYELSYSIPID